METGTNTINRSYKKGVLLLVCSLIAVISSGLTFAVTTSTKGIISPIGKSINNFIPDEKPLEKYTIEQLSLTQLPQASIIKQSIIKEENKHSEYIFSIQVDNQKVTGQLNIPKSIPPSGGFPVIVMNRGFIEPEAYQTGMGTKNAAAYFADRGFVTIAPDFLGFGGSDKEDNNPMAARVKKPVTTLTILYSIKTLNQWTKIDPSKIGMWGHSNGGQISLTILEVLGNSPYWDQPIPTTLWAPVTSAFPYNILYYTDDFDAVGKSLRQTLYNFELLYDTDQFSFHRYLDWIDSPILLHQGAKDDQIPLSWSERLVKSLEERQKSVEYQVYENADHNLKPDWNTVIARDVEFFKNHLN